VADRQDIATGAPTADQIRRAIDSGRSGEKVDVADPAAAPLGTDAEAAGTPPSAGERRSTATTEVHPTRPEAGKTANPRGGPGAIWVGVGLGVGAAVVLGLLLSAAVV
jgi:hypothetical protein